MKSAILRAFGRSSRDVQQAVIVNTLSMMKRTISQPVLGHVQKYKADGWRTVLATAAPEWYARPFSEALGFDDCLASAMAVESDDWEELMGEHKAVACRAWANREARAQAPEIAAITDHRDDLPLLRLAKTAIVQSPVSETSWLQALDADLHVERIDPTEPNNLGGMWLWINDGPSGPHDIWEVRTILSKHRYALLYRGGVNWDRVRPGEDLTSASLRTDCPLPPAPFVRVSIAARRYIVRDMLGVFH